MSVISLAEHKKRCCGPKQDDATGIVYLPVAPQIVARTRFSAPPQPRSRCLMVPEALALLDDAMADKGDSIGLVAIAGPGDPLATPDITLHTIAGVREKYPDLPITLKTYGIGSKTLAPDLARAGLSRLEMQVNGIKADVLEKLYAWIRPGQKTLKIGEAAKTLIEEQRNGVVALKFHNIGVTVRTTLYPGYNLHQIGRISQEMMELGADGVALLPYSPEPGAEVDLDSPSEEEVNTAQAAATKYLPSVSSDFPATPPTPEEGAEATALQLAKPSKEKPNLAVVSSNGMEIDLHLGQAIRFLIYGPRDDGLTCLLETRDAPEPGHGPKRWEQVAETLGDCFVLLAASAGETPRRVLAEYGLTVAISNDNIEGTVDALYGGGKKGKQKNKR